MPLTHHISISVQVLTPKLNPCPLPILISRLMTQWPCTLINEHAMVSNIGFHTPESPSSLPCQKPTPFKVKVVFSKPVHAVRGEVAHPVPPWPFHWQAYHVHKTLGVTPSTSCCSNLSADAKPVCKRAETIFSVRCALWCNQKCTTGFNGLMKWVQPKSII